MRKYLRLLLVVVIMVIIINIINPLTMRVVGAPQMILQPVFSIFPCSRLPSGTCWTPGLSIPWCCLPTSSFVRLVFFPLSLCLARWFWPDLMNGKHDYTTAVCISLQSIGDLHQEIMVMWRGDSICMDMEKAMENIEKVEINCAWLHVFWHRSGYGYVYSDRTM